MWKQSIESAARTGSIIADDLVVHRFLERSAGGGRSVLMIGLVSVICLHRFGDNAVSAAAAPRMLWRHASDKITDEGATSQRARCLLCTAGTKSAMTTSNRNCACKHLQRRLRIIQGALELLGLALLLVEHGRELDVQVLRARVVLLRDARQLLLQLRDLLPCAPRLLLRLLCYGLRRTSAQSFNRSRCTPPCIPAANAADCCHMSELVHKI